MGVSQEGHFGFEQCQGCQPCACGPAAKGSECHPQSGQCHCQPGTTGPQCLECAPGYWGLPEKGCRREYWSVARQGGDAGILGHLQSHLPTSISAGCQCPQGHCDPHTGHCTCPPGLSGERCDTCSQQYQVPVAGKPGTQGIHCEGELSLCPSPFLH